MVDRLDRETRRRARANKRKHYGGSLWYCQEFGHDYRHAPYKSEKVAPGYAVERCSNCGQEQVVQVGGGLRRRMG